MQTAILTANVAGNPLRNFEIDPAALIAAEKSARNGGDAIVGYFHSHPNARGEPSQADIFSAANDGRIWVIIAGESVTAWRPQTSADGEIQAFEPVAIIEG